MESSIFKKAGEFLAEKSKRRNWQIAVTALGIVVILSTAYVLSKPAQTLVKETYCGMEEHEHTEECYELTLICGLGEEDADAETDGTAEGGNPEIEPTPVPAEPSAPEMQPEYVEERILTCGQAVSHVHTLNCFAGAQDLICGLAESEEHSHTEECRAVTVIKALTCGQEESGEHAHSDECYTVVGAKRFTCTEAESENHTHGEGCYSMLGEAELLCKVEKAEGHTHTDECYTVTEKKDLICVEEETEGHAHGEECYTTAAKEELVCEDTSEEHEHTAECYQVTEEQELVCEKEETPGHVHTEECYAVSEERELICGQEEREAVEPEHVHTLACSTMVQREVPAADTADTEDADNTENVENAEAAEEHVHTEECYALMPVCGYEEHAHGDLCREEPKCGIEAHTHRPDCYDEEGSLVCETEEHKHAENCYKDPHCGISVHLHMEDCYDEEGNLICGLEEHIHGEECYFEIPTYHCLGRMHVHSDECRDEEENVICGYADFAVHTHDEACYDPNMRLVCPLPEIEEHVHTEECYVQESEEEEPQLVCEKEEIVLHTHSEECFGEDGKPACGQTEILVHQHNDECYVELEAEEEKIVKTFAGDEFTVTAVYGSDANLPEDAELLAELITAEDNEAHYAQREAQYREAMGNEEATMRALLKIGFYADGEEVEPEAPVTITVQFLDENGLEEGSPITVVHFGEDTEVLEGSDVKDGKTSFEMKSFSELAIGYGKATATVTVHIDESYKYETDAFNIDFHVKGSLQLPTEGGDAQEDKGESNNTISSVSGGNAANGGNTVSDGNAALAEGFDDVLTGAFPNDEMTESDSERTEEISGEESTVQQGPDNSIEENGETVYIEESNQISGMEFWLNELDEESEEYITAVTYAEEIGEGTLDNTLLLQVFAYGLTYMGADVDLANCEVTAEITPTQDLIEYAEQATDIATLELEGYRAVPEDELQDEVTLFGIEIVDGSQIGDNTEGIALSSATAKQSVRMTLANGVMAVTATRSAANVAFTVQYYANLEVIATTGSNGLDVIDTDNGGTGKNGKLPHNVAGGKENEKLGGANKKTIYLTKTDQTVNAGNGYTQYRYRVTTKKQVTEVYKAHGYKYFTAPNLKYFDRLADNHNYELKEIWISSNNGTSWKKYNSSNGYTLSRVYFTNRPNSAKDDKAGDTFVLITEGTLIRLVYDPTSTNHTNSHVTFYDYDISDGKILTKSEAEIKLDDGSTAPNAGKYINTNKKGINSVKGINFAFGNNNTRTTLGTKTFTSSYNGKTVTNELNKTNANGYKGCTFQIADSLKANGTIKYSSGVTAPQLFNDGGDIANAKKSYPDSSITFIRNGDTYTMTSVSVKDGGTNRKLNNLHLFNHPANYGIWTNNFWPMDKVTTKTDPVFGSTRYYTFSAADTVEGTPVADDFKNHNAYFGMYYTVDFELSEDYVGPLEYLFYGDDDMWVFLSKKNDNGSLQAGKLICDIGGVHSSVGEYVNLWDWIKKGDSGSYRLSFFYTERGASGSSCWMQFTLPSVSFNAPEQRLGKLRIEKEVTGIEIADKEFGFTVKFKDSKNDYAYEKYNANNEVISNDVLIWDNAKFTLKAGEYIIVNGLPEGTEYTITEIGEVEVQKDENGDIKYDINGNPIWTEVKDISYNPVITGGKPGETVWQVKGTITKNSTVTVHYNNVQQFILPETGSTGTTLYTIAGVIVLLGGAGFLYRKKFRERRV